MYINILHSYKYMHYRPYEWYMDQVILKYLGYSYAGIHHYKLYMHLLMFNVSYI